jgi:hypothetical protein
MQLCRPRNPRPPGQVERSGPAISLRGGRTRPREFDSLIKLTKKQDICDHRAQAVGARGPPGLRGVTRDPGCHRSGLPSVLGINRCSGWAPVLSINTQYGVQGVRPEYQHSGWAHSACVDTGKFGSLVTSAASFFSFLISTMWYMDIHVVSRNST